ncbi:aspartate aminotransferase family protein [Pacificimonas sp. WHA3]|uniref:Aspartate aminotransferase family protein n=1 Tax=Pacificimonas pallii TaxID=2827236 RepID=A0ABS6SCS8_9SPHN|nr:pyridoxal-dependent decarboxylase [Pacificimonas pallii]MBV7256131.1 aspartate aminotransferase family protein [Pacificimonas pallii]
MTDFGTVQEAQADQLLKSAFDSLAQYRRSLAARPAYPSPLDLAQLADLDTNLPRTGEEPAEVLHQLATLGNRTAVPTTGGRYFGFVTGGVLPIGLAARILADGWDQASALHVMSPLAATLEELCERWIVKLLGLPEETLAGFVTGTSMATLCAFAAARHHLLKQLGWNTHDKGLAGAPPLRVIVNENAHSCIWRALRLLGFGENQFEKVRTDFQGRILTDQLPVIDNRCLVILQAGDVNTGSFDNFAAMSKITFQTGAWVHVDGAFGLWAACSPAYRNLTGGVEFADSWACDAHKTLNAPYECGLVLCRHEAAYREAMHTGASYAPLTQQRDGMALVPEMSRRARAIEIWAILRSLGRDGVAALVERLAKRANQMADLLVQAGIPVINDVVFNQVLVQFGDDGMTNRILGRIQASGECWCGGSRWKGRSVIRFSVCSWATTEDDIRRAAAAFIAARNAEADIV